MGPTLQEAITALKPFLKRNCLPAAAAAKHLNLVKALSGRFKSALRKGESSVKVIRALRNTHYGRI